MAKYFQILDSRSLEIASIELNNKILDYCVESVGILGEKIIIDVGKRQSGEEL